MYAVEVRDHIMVAHSFKGALFGPAQSLHGATFIVDVAFFRDELTADGVVVDIGRAHDALKQTLAPLNYKNLDTVPEFDGPEHDDGIFGQARVRRHGGGGVRRPAGSRFRRDRPHPRHAARVRIWREPGMRGRSSVIEVVFAVPGDLATPTGGYAYARQVLARLPDEGLIVRHVTLPAAFPHPAAADLDCNRAAAPGNAGAGRAAHRRPRLRGDAGRSHPGPSPDPSWRWSTIRSPSRRG